MPLTDTKIKAASPAEKPYKLYDREGVFALIRPNGSKLWRFKYVVQGKEKLMALGEYPAVSLASARKRASEARAMLAEGVDPMAARKAEQQRAENSFQRVSERWHEWWAQGVDADTAAYILRRLQADVFPTLGGTPIDEIKAADIRNLILAIEQGKGEGRRFKGKGARDVAQRQFGTLSQIFRYAVTHGMAERNPAADFKPSDVLAPHKAQHRAHIEPASLPGLLLAVDAYDRKPVLRLALKLMALTFVRTQELLQAPWSEFDLDNARWTVTAARMKKGRPHIVPLSHQALAILRELKQLAGDKPFVFPGMNRQSEGKTINSNALLNVIKEIGYKGIMTGHGFRGLARTILAEHGFDKAHVELQLSHSNDDKVEAAYNHAQYLQQRTELMQWWADYLDDQLVKGQSKIVAINRSVA